MKEVVAIIKEHERPVKFYFRTTPSRSLSPDIIKQKLRSRFTPTPKTRIPKRVSEHFVSVVFGPGPMGMELVQRRKGGAMIKSISKGGAADQSGKLRRSMVLATVDNEDCTKLKLAEVLKKLPEFPKIMEKANQALTFMASGQIPQNSKSYSALKEKELEMKTFRNQSIIGFLLLVFFGFIVF